MGQEDNQETSKHPLGKLFRSGEVAGFVIVLAGIQLTSFYHYLLFHSLVELFSVCVAATIFVIAFNSWQLIRNQYLIFIGTSYAFIALLDTLHTLAYTGMGIFKDYDYYAPQLWIASRGMESLSMMAAFAFLGTRIRLRQSFLIAGYSVATALLVASIFVWKVFPVCFVAGQGLTPFKIYSEYVIITVFLIAFGLLVSKRAQFDARVFRLLATSILIMAAMEFCFTLYYSNTMSDTANEIGHLLKIIAFYFIYKAIVVTGIRDPINLLFRDLKEKEARLIEAEQQAMFYDPLTGLPNRRLFLDRLRYEISKMHHAGRRMCLLYIDIDRFREINDTLGHDKGDMLLVEATRRIRDCARESDTLARHGGDEFMLILSNYGETAVIDHIVQCLLTALSLPFNLGLAGMARVSGSIGIVRYPEDATTLDELLQCADQALEAAKSQGRNNFCYFTESMQQEALEKAGLTNDLSEALERGQLEVYFQPIVEAATGRIAKAEALLRWHHPERGMVPPSLFIPLAEESGLIVEIGEWVFHEAVHHIKSWRDRAGIEVQVSVNKSPAQFARGRREGWLDLLEELGLPGNAITVEITEGLLLTESDQTQTKLLEYQNRNIEVSIDDFGTGFSALSYLTRFDIDYLKIDRSFVANLTSNSSNRDLTEAIILMAHKLGIKTIAEGVETETQRDLLQAQGCDYIQGFLYSPPVPSAAFESMLRNMAYNPAASTA
jgi:diguanylate cyclase (GGDEF)-like protein